MFRKLLVLILAWMVWAPGARAAEVPDGQEASHEAALLVGGETVTPAVLAVPAGRLRIWVVNTGAKSLQAEWEGIPSQAPASLAPGKLVSLEPGVLAAGEYTLRLAGAEGPRQRVAVQVGKAVSSEFVLIRTFQHFYPEVTPLPAGKALTVHLYALTPAPHRDFQLLPDGPALPFAFKKLVTQNWAEGLAAGTYRISRPGYPKQRHGIHARLEVSAGR